MDKKVIKSLCDTCIDKDFHCFGCTITRWGQLHPEATIEEGADSVVECDNYEQR